MSTSAPSPQPAPAAPALKQPRGLFLLFGVEMWERFSFYGMRALLVLFLVDKTAGLSWSDEAAAKLYAWYLGLVYLTPVFGGYLADRYLGTHLSLVIGGSIIAAGHFCLALHSQATFFLGLILIILGTGFFKSNVSTMVGQLYQKNDARRDGGFTIFYMGINLGAFIGPLLCGWLAHADGFGWHWGFGAAGVGMVIGLCMYLVLKRRYLGDVGGRPSRTAVSSGQPHHHQPLTHVERTHVLALLVSAFFVFFFWLAFEQAGSSMNLFAQRYTDRLVMGEVRPAEWFQSINPLAILIFAPVFALLWRSLAARGREPSTPVKMAIGLLLESAGFVVLVVAAILAGKGTLVSPMWLVTVYLVHTWGELCLSPVGLSMVTKLAPARFASLLMGVWFLTNFLSDLTAGLLAAQANRVARGEVFHAFGGQADFFLIFVISSACAGIVLLALSPIVKRLMKDAA